MNTKVLIVDDENEFLMLLADHLTEKGASTDFAANHHDARELLLSQHIDVLVTDVMVNQRGAEAAAEFVEFAKEHCPWIKIIAMTGLDRSEVMFTLRQKGVDAIILKPFALYEMAQLVMSVASKNSESPSPRTITGKSSSTLSLGPARLLDLTEKVLAEHSAY